MTLTLGQGLWEQEWNNRARDLPMETLSPAAIMDMDTQVSSGPGCCKLKSVYSNIYINPWRNKEIPETSQTTWTREPMGHCLRYQD